MLPSIQAHNLNLSSDLHKGDERKQLSSGPEQPTRSVTPLPPSPSELGPGNVEVLLVMKPLKQRDLLRAVCGAFQALQAAKEEGEQTQKAGQAAAQKAEESKAALPDSAAAAAEPTVTAVARPLSARGKLSAVSDRVPVSRIARISDSVPLHILLAEDNKINQKMMSMLLGKLGFRIVIAENGREVIDIVSRGVSAPLLHDGGKAASGKGKEEEAGPPLPAAAVLEVAGREAAVKQGATAAGASDRVPFDVILMDGQQRRQPQAAPAVVPLHHCECLLTWAVLRVFCPAQCRWRRWTGWSARRISVTSTTACGLLPPLLKPPLGLVAPTSSPAQPMPAASSRRNATTSAWTTGQTDRRQSCATAHTARTRTLVFTRC